MDWDNAVLLEPEEVIPTRPFSHPRAGAQDIQKMRQMARKLRTLLAGMGERLEEKAAATLDLIDDEGARNRIIIPNPPSLNAPIDVAAVGFFGQIRDDIDHDPLMSVEEELVGRLPDAPGLLTYYNRHHPQEGYGNLVLFTDKAAKKAWRHTDPHDEAVRLTPFHYHSVRLHNGSIQGGVLNGGDFILRRTRYYDFQSRPPWLAERRYPLG